MLKFYFNGSPNPTKVALFLEEAGLAYEPIAVDTRTGAQFNQDFLKVNPNGKVPAIDDDGVKVFDSNAILLYLAEKTGKFLPKDMTKKYDVLQWLMFQLTGIGPMFGQFTHFKLFAPKDNAYSMSRYQTEVKRLYEVMEKQLAQSPYLGGDEYTIADIATFPWTRNHDIQGVKWDDHPNLARWFKAIDERPAVKAALAKIAIIKSNRETATDDQKDRFFNRGRYALA
jgi:GST-like protein